MYDEKYDLDQDLLYQHNESDRARSVPEAGREGRSDSLTRADEKAQSETAIQALIYTKFVTLSQSIRPLVAELEHRSSINPDELRALLSECHSAYISTRQSLLGARVSNEVGRLDPRNSDLVDLVCAFTLLTTKLTSRLELDAAI